MSSNEIVSRFLLKSFLKWKFFKDNPTLPWKSSRCSCCAVPLFADNFTLCVICFAIQEENDRRDEEQEMEQIQRPCCICGAEAEDGPCQAFCSRACLRIWNRG